MSSNATKTLEKPLYLWLLGVYPIIHIYSLNLGLVIDHEVGTSLLVKLAATTIAFVLTNVFVRNKQKTALMLSILSICFSFSGHLYTLVFIPRSLFIWTLMILIATVCAMAMVYRIGSRYSLVRVASAANLIVLALLASPTLQILSSFTTASTFVQLEIASQPIALNDVSKVLESSRPDIYYIIPDAYPSDSWLQDAMNFDNSAFTRALEDRGVVIADHAQSNYGATLHSLASILNMQYYDSNPTNLQDLDYLRLSVADNKVAQQLQQLGYTYIQLLSGFLLPSSIADINRDFTPSGTVDIEVNVQDLSTANLKTQSESTESTKLLIDRRSSYKQSFISLYVDTTLLRIVNSQLDKLLKRDELMPYHVNDAERFLATVDHVRSITDMSEATFAIIHLIKPHAPTVFDEQGEIIRRILEPSPEEWFGELEFINSKFLETIDNILANSQNQPVIIFQADHGSTYGNPRAEGNRPIHFDAYAAFYVPDSHSLSLPQPYTLINTFPLIFNAVFGSDYELQPDRLIELSIGYDTPFKQADVTDTFLRF